MILRNERQHRFVIITSTRRTDRSRDEQARISSRWGRPGGGRGRLDVMALGVIPVARAERSSALMRGELMRYLAELAWAPDAFLFNTTLRWREDGPDRLSVSAGAGETAVEVTLSLDSDGRIAGAFAPDRPRSATAPIQPTPWRGRFCDYRHNDTRWLPIAGEVAWEIDGKETIYWQGRIDGWGASDDRA